MYLGRVRWSWSRHGSGSSGSGDSVTVFIDEYCFGDFDDFNCDVTLVFVDRFSDHGVTVLFCDSSL